VFFCLRCQNLSEQAYGQYVNDQPNLNLHSNANHFTLIYTISHNLPYSLFKNFWVFDCASSEGPKEYNASLIHGITKGLLHGENSFPADVKTFLYNFQNPIH